MSQQQNNHRNNKNNRNRSNKNKHNGQRNQRANDKDQTDRKVPMRYQIRNSKETSSVEFKCEIDGAVEKTKLNDYEDGNDEEYLKMIKEFQNYVETYNIWDDDNASSMVYQNFRRCLAGSARDLWDQINVIEGNEVRDDVTFWDHLSALTKAIIGEDALHEQKDYLKNTSKQEKMSVKQWVNRLKNITSYLPMMEQDARSFTEEELISEVISKIIPSAWRVQYILAKLHLKKKINDIMSDLTLIEESIKTHPTNHLKNPCRVHNGGHEWDDGRQNPKNAKSDGKEKPNDNRNRTDQTNRTREHRRTERENCRPSRTGRSRSSSRSRDSDRNDEYHCLDQKEKRKKNSASTPSSEILIAVPNAKNSNKYTTYLGLVASGSSGSFINSEIVHGFSVTKHKRPTKWDTATGVLLTKGTTTIDKCRLPQFNRKRNVSSTFHLFEKRSNDKYDVILGRDLLQAIGLGIQYSTNRFTWDDISIDMVPRGYWTQERISNIAKTWNNPVVK